MGVVDAAPCTNIHGTQDLVSYITWWFPSQYHSLPGPSQGSYQLCGSVHGLCISCRKGLSAEQQVGQDPCPKRSSFICDAVALRLHMGDPFHCLPGEDFLSYPPTGCFEHVHTGIYPGLLTLENVLFWATIECRAYTFEMLYLWTCPLFLKWGLMSTHSASINVFNIQFFHHM